MVLAEDHPVMSHALRRLLGSELGIEVVADACDLACTITQVMINRPAVLILDLRLQGGLGVDGIRRLRALSPDTEIVVLTMHDNPAFAEHVHAAGAIGFVLKDLADTDLAAAVLAASNGVPYTSRGIGGHRSR